MQVKARQGYAGLTSPAKVRIKQPAAGLVSPAYPKRLENRDSSQNGGLDKPA
jgi:hypothetical protein